ncbi:hypothetical protein PHSC3_000641 [Chlamydiales bacterium STE3]|nr:hypothetical protein PHSC3_000641 [Chlamydiales bacterium STE3]
MMRFFPIVLLPFFAFCIEQGPFYNLDNTTIANEVHLATDPFLALRTKATSRDTLYRLEDSILAMMGHQSLFEEEIEFPEDSEELSLLIGNKADTFYYENPCFHLHAKGDKPSKVWWQIALDPLFNNTLKNFDQIETYQSKIVLDDLCATFLNPLQPYYFRAKFATDRFSSPWSETFKFSVQKPNQVQNIVLKKISNGKYELIWEKDSSPTVEYLLFASNSQDFIPSTYSEEQFLSLSENVKETAPNYNLIGSTPSNRIEIDGQLAYYRIIAVDHGQLSIPSELIYIYDNDLTQYRDHLTYCEHSQSIQRTPFQECNPYSCLKKSLIDCSTHPHISSETWAKVKPFLVPENHPLKVSLDTIFSKSRVTQNLNSLRLAGFRTTGGGKNSHSKTIFCKHKNLKDSVLKIIPDDYPEDEVAKLTSRIIGAQAVKEVIDRENYGHFIKVPKKWLYVLPPEPSPKPGSYRKNFILIADDMLIYNRETNYAMWKSFLLTPELLQAIYNIITKLGLDDCVHAFNLPFCKDGKVAFLDTEDHHRWPVHYRSLDKYLNPEMQKFWRQLTH